MYPRALAQGSSLRIVLVFTIALSLLLGTSVLWINRIAAQEQDQWSKREGRPKPGKPEGNLPNLEDVQNESRVEPGQLPKRAWINSLAPHI